MSATKNLLKN